MAVVPGKHRIGIERSDLLRGRLMWPHHRMDQPDERRNWI
jgi:hypothetical protein